MFFIIIILVRQDYTESKKKKIIRDITRAANELTKKKRKEIKIKKQFTKMIFIVVICCCCSLSLVLCSLRCRFVDIYPFHFLSKTIKSLMELILNSFSFLSISGFSFQSKFYSGRGLFFCMSNLCIPVCCFCVILCCFFSTFSVTVTVIFIFIGSISCKTTDDQTKKIPF